MHNRFFRKIEQLNDYYVRVWEEVCNIESPTSFKQGVDAVNDYFIKMALERGFEVEVFEQKVSGNVVRITMNPTAKGKPISISGHVDTVHPVGLFGTPAVRIEGDKIYGPGVEDCKGGVVAGFLAMDALRDEGYTERPIHLFLQSDEEVGSRFSKKETIRFICERAYGSEAFINLEGSKAGTACLIRKGILSVIFNVKGREAHSAKCATEGANAILEAAYKIAEIEKIKDEKGVTCCCSMINGGTAANTVPAQCSFTVNVRFANQEQYEWIYSYLEGIAEKTHVDGCSCSLERLSERYAMEYCDRNIELLEKINAALIKSDLPTLKMEGSLGGSDAADVTVYGIPCVDSLGVRGGKIHTPDEFSFVDSLSEAAKRLVSIIYYL